MSIDALDIIRTETERSVAALAAASPDQQVPTCPDWTADDLLWHIAEVHEFWAAILAGPVTDTEQAQAIEEGKDPRPEGREGLLARRQEATASLLSQLEAHDDEDPAWFWYSARQGVGITRRMQTHEATIHRVDAELTAGRPVTPIPADVAADGIAHVLEVMWPAGFEWIPDWAEIRPVAVAEIRAGDGDGRLLEISRWSGTRPRDGQEFDAPVARLLEDPAQAGDLPRAVVTGSAQALDLWAWGREQAIERLAGDEDRVRVQGDSAAIAQVEKLIAEGHD
ncbi:maleylpyruvate isomerase family mycothiol-dependent enzyme [Brachybacterium aquaticum]|uniref:Uncharacterized protein (TIGR03083 family) n=1 Tax=Brachybacterium aquaticum TaxID=1432564 RepID=A0A841ACT2_9MICO|nr:maleylpyruvate isomerase family mycothiol-dependent enzyme [Brachybacterium aquaticum]MBB5831040.1 uncharacterized protein (TIGR03083 family) [Brachybacterium aquaticum]